VSNIEMNIASAVMLVWPTGRPKI